MSIKFVGLNGELLDNADANDYMGASRFTLETEVGVTYVAVLPKKFGWNTLTFSPDGDITVLSSTSSMKEIRQGRGIWIPLNTSSGDLPEADSFSPNGTTAATCMFAWEHPLVAFGFEGDGTRVRVEIVSKHD